MRVRVHQVDGGYRIEGDWDGLEPANAFLSHLAGRGFSPATVRAYAFDVVNLARFLAERDLALAVVDAPLVFDWIDWQGVRRSSARVVRGSGPRSAARVDGEPAGRGGASIVRVPGDDRAAWRQSGALAAARSGAAPFGAGAARPSGSGSCSRRRQAGAPAATASGVVAGRRVEAFVATLTTHRDRAMVLAMLLGGLRSAEVRGAAAGRCGYGSAAAAGDRQGRQGTARARGCGVLHRAGGLSALGTPSGAGHAAVFRGAARPDHWVRR